MVNHCISKMVEGLNFKGFKVWEPLWSLGSLKTPNTVNVGNLGNGSKVNGGKIFPPLFGMNSLLPNFIYFTRDIYILK